MSLNGDKIALTLWGFCKDYREGMYVMSWTQRVLCDKHPITLSCYPAWACLPHFSCLCSPHQFQAGPAYLTRPGSGRKYPISAHVEDTGSVTTIVVTSKSDPWTLCCLGLVPLPFFVSSLPPTTVLILSSNLYPVTVLQYPSRTKVLSFFLR